MQGDESKADGGKPAAAPGRWRLRFSLRTLLLGVLLIGSAAVLWWNWGPWAPARTITEKEAILGAGFSPSDKYFWIRTWLDTVALYDAETGKRLFEVAPHHGNPVLLLHPGTQAFRNVNFSPAEQYICLTGEELYSGLNWMFRLSTGESVSLGDAQILAFTTNDRFIVLRSSRMSVSLDGCIQLIALPEKKTVATFDNTSRPVAFSHDGRLLAVQNGGTVAVIDSASGQVERVLMQFSGYVYNLAFSPVDDTLAISEHHKDSTFRTVFVDANTGAQTGECAGMLSHANVPPASNRQLQWESPFSRDGSRVLTFDMHNQYAMGDDSLAKVCTLNSKEEPLTLALHRPLGFSPDGERVYGFAPFSAWDAHSGKMLWKIELESDRDGTFSMDGKFAFVEREKNGKQSRERILDAATGETLFRFSRYRWRNAMPHSRYQVAFASTHDWFITTPNSSGEKWDSPPAYLCKATLWRLRRPVEWWGVMWLVEFWLAVFFAGAFVWSVWRDRKLGRKN